jgi:hypothetical protein
MVPSRDFPKGKDALQDHVVQGLQEVEHLGCCCAHTSRDVGETVRMVKVLTGKTTVREMNSSKTIHEGMTAFVLGGRTLQEALNLKVKEAKMIIHQRPEVMLISTSDCFEMNVLR